MHEILFTANPSKRDMQDCYFQLAMRGGMSHKESGGQAKLNPGLEQVEQRKPLTLLGLPGLGPGPDNA